MTELTPEQLAPLEAQLNSHPAIQAFLHNQSHSALGWVQAVAKATKDLGLQFPHDYQPQVRGGRVVMAPLSFLQRNEWILPAAAVGAPVAAGAALGAFGGAAAAGGGASGAATGAGTATGPLAGGLTPSFGVPASLAGVGGEAGAASGLAHWLPMLAKAGAPAAFSALTHNSSSIDPSLSMPGGPGGSGGAGGYGTGSPLDAQLSELMDFSKRRMQQSEPVHEAAMQLALRMAPGTAGYGRVNEASQNAMHPVPQQQLNPQVLAALHHLMNGQGR